MVRIFSHRRIPRKRDQPKTRPFSLSKKEELDGANLMHLIEYVIGFMKGNCKLDLHRPSLKEKKAAHLSMFSFFSATLNLTLFLMATKGQFHQT